MPIALSTELIETLRTMPATVLLVEVEIDEVVWYIHTGHRLLKWNSHTFIGMDFRIETTGRQPLSVWLEVSFKGCIFGMEELFALHERKFGRISISAALLDQAGEFIENPVEIVKGELTKLYPVSSSEVIGLIREFSLPRNGQP
jgi:hypothetical protein